MEVLSKYTLPVCWISVGHLNIVLIFEEIMINIALLTFTTAFSFATARDLVANFFLRLLNTFAKTFPPFTMKYLYIISLESQVHRSFEKINKYLIFSSTKGIGQGEQRKVILKIIINWDYVFECNDRIPKQKYVAQIWTRMSKQWSTYLKNTSKHNKLANGSQKYVLKKILNAIVYWVCFEELNQAL